MSKNILFQIKKSELSEMIRF